MRFPFPATIILTGLLLFLFACGEKQTKETEPETPAAPKLNDIPDLKFFKARLDHLPGFADDKMQAALTALSHSCRLMLKWPADKSLHLSNRYGFARDWKPACQVLDELPLPLDEDQGGGGNIEMAKTTLISQTRINQTRINQTRINQTDKSGVIDTESILKLWLLEYFTPWAVEVNNQSQGLFTGYFEPLLKGSFKPDDRYKYPLYRRPDNLIEVDLGDFKDAWKGQKVKGRLEGTKLVPYEDRAAIVAGVLDQTGAAAPLLYVDNYIDAFFLHIQGSGRVRLKDGSLQRVGYADQNGHEYVSIGRLLKEKGEIAADKLSMQSIRAWLEAHPLKATDLLLKNKSYVFFRLLEGTNGPYGSAGIPLTPERSLAVDRQYLALNVPMWLSTSHPDPARPFDSKRNPGSKKSPEKQIDFNRLMVAQDTGGAIRGEIRGDIFWGFGERAAEISGRMANKGRYWILLPKGIDPNTIPPDTPVSLSSGR